jgi:hypothetical protein
MKSTKLILSIVALMLVSLPNYGQTKTYTTSGGEIIFSWGDLKYTDAFQSSYDQASISSQPVRFTTFLHLQQRWHLDLNNSIGFFTGLSLRNIGMTSDEVLPENYQDANPTYFNAKIIRRTYSVGVPLAIKLGSFNDHLYVYAGGEMEWAFHYKEKWWDNHSRSGSKTKTTTWWPNQVTTFLPSAFVGLQFPGGVNLKFKYYLENFLNSKEYNNYANATNRSHVVSDLTKYEQSNLFYVSISFNFKTANIIKQLDSSDTVASLY